MTSLLPCIPDAEVRMLTLAQAARLLGRSPDTLRKQVHNGRLRATLIGKTYVVTEREVERYRRQSLGQVGRPEGARDRAPRRRKDSD